MDYEERQSLRTRKVTINVHLPITMIEVLDKLADAEEVSTNRVVERLVRRGLAIERDERAAKALKAV
jgi:hypothetical protein